MFHQQQSQQTGLAARKDPQDKDGLSGQIAKL